jgi:hypothetical protein
MAKRTTAATKKPATHTKEGLAAEVTGAALPTPQPNLKPEPVEHAPEVNPGKQTAEILVSLIKELDAEFPGKNFQRLLDVE